MVDHTLWNLCLALGILITAPEQQAGPAANPIRWSQVQRQPQSLFDATQVFPRDRSDLLGKGLFPDGEDLGHVRDRIFREARPDCLQEYISWGAGECKVGSDGHHDHGPDPAFVECIGLDDQDRAPVTGRATRGRREVRPPDLAAGRIHHSPSGKDLLWSSPRTGSRIAGSWS